MDEYNFQFPHGEILTGVSVKEDKNFGGTARWFDEIVLTFGNRSIGLYPLADTDEIAIRELPETRKHRRNKSLPLQNLIGEMLVYSWICPNCQGYLDLVVFAFDHITPCVGIVCEVSSLKILEMRELNKPSERKVG